MVNRSSFSKVLDLGTCDRPAQPDKKGGISAICATTQPGTFATGGYDHLVHLWSLPDDYDASPSLLSIRHTSVVQSLLAIQDTSHKLLSGSADCSVSVYDISAERVINLLKLSNSIYNVHSTSSPFCALLEIGHRELQFEVRDLRLVPASPVVRFGYRNTKVHGRYTRGDLQNDVFACGGSERDGCVRLWDLRKPVDPFRTVDCFPGRKATQVKFDGTHLFACSEDHQLVSLQYARPEGVL
ncbi:WD40-repeat-containing domain protein [Daedaleopsis nitida]|nr:WD40-repeat-containing domain protein [Daedaleopsis nitida]